MNIRVITPPTEEPITLTEAKAFLRVDGTSDDALITSLIVAARERGEEIARKAYVTQTLEQTVDVWSLVMRVARPPLQSVTSVKYTDYYGTEATWTDYRVDAKSDPGAILYTTLPGTSLQQTGAITIRFVAGYGAAAAVPQRVKNAILALVMYWYESRETANIPSGLYDAFVSDRTVWY